jgi:hypothetical protein
MKDRTKSCKYGGIPLPVLKSLHTQGRLHYTVYSTVYTPSRILLGKTLSFDKAMLKVIRLPPGERESCSLVFILSHMLGGSMSIGSTECANNVIGHEILHTVYFLSLNQICLIKCMSKICSFSDKLNKPFQKYSHEKRTNIL